MPEQRKGKGKIPEPHSGMPTPIPAGEKPGLGVWDAGITGCKSISFSQTDRVIKGMTLPSSVGTLAGAQNGEHVVEVRSLQGRSNSGATEPRADRWYSAVGSCVNVPS